MAAPATLPRTCATVDTLHDTNGAGWAQWTKAFQPTHLSDTTKNGAFNLIVFEKTSSLAKRKKSRS
jgi:hypothetical protein